MDVVRNSGAWLAARLVLMQEMASDRKDRGEGPVSYMAVILLIALVAGAIVALGIDDQIANGIKNAVSRVWNQGTSGGS